MIADMLRLVTDTIIQIFPPGVWSSSDWSLLSHSTNYDYTISNSLLMAKAGLITDDGNSPDISDSCVVGSDVAISVENDLDGADFIQAHYYSDGDVGIGGGGTTTKEHSMCTSSASGGGTVHKKYEGYYDGTYYPYFLVGGLTSFHMFLKASLTGHNYTYEVRTEEIKTIGQSKVARLYKLGTEEVDWVEGYFEGNSKYSYVTKEDDHLSLTVESAGNPVVTTFVTDNVVDLTDIDRLYVMWEGVVGEHSGSYLSSHLQISTSKTGDHTSYTAEVIKELTFEKQEAYLDVSSYTGNYYIKLHCVADSIKDMILNVYYVGGLKTS